MNKYRFWNGTQMLYYDLFEIPKDIKFADKPMPNIDIDADIRFEDSGIFLSDICEYEYWIQSSLDPDSCGILSKGVGAVVYNDGCFMINDLKNKKFIPIHYADLSIHKIGNIYEDKELLEQEDE